MKIKTTTQALFELAEVRKESSTISLLITTDIFSENTPRSVALQLLYCDLMLAGAGDLSREDFQYKLNELGSSILITNNEGRITFTLTALAEKLNPTLKLLELMLTKPSFKVSEQKRAVRTIKNGLELYKENARGLAHSGLKNSFFNNTSRYFTFTPKEIAEALTKITIKDLKEFHLFTFKSYWTIGLGGNNKSVDIVLESIKRIKKDSLPKQKLNSASSLVFNGKKSVIQHEVKSKQNLELSIGGYLPLTLEDEDLPAFLFGLSVLGKWGGFAGRLMSTVREKEGLTYMIYARIEGVTKSEAGLWRIASFFAPKDVIKGISSTLREIETIEQKGITESELIRFKTILKTGETLVFDSLSNTTALVHSKLVAGVTWDEYQEFRSRLYACSRKEVNQALKKYLNSKSLTISLAGPIATVKKELELFTK